MRSSLAILFVILYLVALCRPLAPLLEFYAQRDYFATILCINKDKPQLHCNGQCVLMVKLKTAMKEETVPVSPLPKVSFEDYPLSEIWNPEDTVGVGFVLAPKSFSRVGIHYVSPSGAGYFHPPQLS
ncbi:MAG TPA: hypothetical protein VGK59_23185 [Ohtaekwangia sp.]